MSREPFYIRLMLDPDADLSKNELTIGFDKNLFDLSKEIGKIITVGIKVTEPEEFKEVKEGML